MKGVVQDAAVGYTVTNVVTGGLRNGKTVDNAIQWYSGWGSRQCLRNIKVGYRTTSCNRDRRAWLVLAESRPSFFDDELVLGLIRCNFF